MGPGKVELGSLSLQEFLLNVSPLSPQVGGDEASEREAMRQDKMHFKALMGH